MPPEHAAPSTIWQRYDDGDSTVKDSEELVSTLLMLSMAVNGCDNAAPPAVGGTLQLQATLCWCYAGERTQHAQHQST